MKTLPTKLTETRNLIASSTATRKRVARPDAAVSGQKSKKRDNIFSKSRDTREDRGLRQMKTSKNPQTVQHGR